MLGNQFEKRNAFQCDEVLMKLPSSEKHDLGILWVSKIRLDNGHIACDLLTFVDDGCVTAPSKSESFQATRQAQRL